MSTPNPASDRNIRALLKWTGGKEITLTDLQEFASDQWGAWVARRRVAGKHPWECSVDVWTIFILNPLRDELARRGIAVDYDR